MRKIKVLVLALILLLLCSTSYAQHDDVKKLEEKGVILTLEEIIMIASKDHKGRILEAELSSHKGGYIYQIDIFSTDGVIWELRYDATNGSLLAKEKDWK